MNTIVVRPAKRKIYSDGGRRAPAFEVVLAGAFPQVKFPQGNVELTLRVHDIDPAGDTHQNADILVATITGTLQRMSKSPREVKYHHFTLTGVQSQEAKTPADVQTYLDDANNSGPVVGFAFSTDTSPGAIKWFALPKARPVLPAPADPNSGQQLFKSDTWELELHLSVPNGDPAVVSPSFVVGWNVRAVPHRFVRQPLASYDWHAGNEVLFYNDAFTDQAGAGGYFHDVEQAIEAARSIVLIVDWSFHPVVRLTPGDVTLDNCLGARLIRKAAGGNVLVAVLTWYHGFPVNDPPNDECQDIMRKIAADLGLPNTVLWRGAVAKGTGYSHHQKFVVVDDGTQAPGRARLKVFYGGLDLTQGRTDWDAHHVQRDDQACSNFLENLTHQVIPDPPQNWTGHGGPYNDWYNAEFTSSDYKIPPPESPPQQIHAVRFLAVQIAVFLPGHGYNKGDVIRIDGDPAIAGDRVVDDAPNDPAQFPADDWFCITELDGSQIIIINFQPYGGQTTVTRNPARFPRQPWHDVHAQLDGPIAWDFAREFVGRWEKVIWPPSGDSGNTRSADITRVWNAFMGLFDRQRFVQQWEDHVRAADEGQPFPNAPPAGPAHAAIFAGQVIRSFRSVHLGNPKANDLWHPGWQEMRWVVNGDFERSIQDSYLKAILEAERFIYIENQYFIGSGPKLRPPRPKVQNRVPEALVKRILEMKNAGRPFHVYVIMPQFPEGPAVYGTWNPLPAVRNLEWRTIAYMINAIGQNWDQYLSFYFLQRSDLGANEGPYPPNTDIRNEAIRRTANVIRNQRYMIYVHCKLMIVDDRYLILGSANINERSMSGDRDSEICVALWPQSSQTSAACEANIETLRLNLLGEHLGVPLAPAILTNPEGLAFRTAIQAQAQANFRGLLAAPPLPNPRLQGHLVMFPFEVGAPGKWAAPAWAPADILTQYIIDSINTGMPGEDPKGYWSWESGTPNCCSILPDSLIE